MFRHGSDAVVQDLPEQSDVFQAGPPIVQRLLRWRHGRSGDCGTAPEDCVTMRSLLRVMAPLDPGGKHVLGLRNRYRYLLRA
jgi:hypothetical protein